MKRLVQPEILDSLPQDHPDAKANRRDLRLINRVMGNYSWFRDRLPPLLTPEDRILEIGSGTGDLGLYLDGIRKGRGAIQGPAKTVSPTATFSAHYCGLDLWSRPANWPREWKWVQDDLLNFDRYQNFTVLIANLILHQFDDDALRSLGEKLSSSGIRLILASEPARHKIHQWQLKLLWPLGLNAVSRHDGHVSVAGGFRQNELPDLLGLTDPAWQVETKNGVRGASRMIAIRQGGDSA
ncbi:MAG: hypothetical protein WD490_05690 [Opitutales bacterium]